MFQVTLINFFYLYIAFLRSQILKFSYFPIKVFQLLEMTVSVFGMKRIRGKELEGYQLTFH